MKTERKSKAAIRSRLLDEPTQREPRAPSGLPADPAVFWAAMDLPDDPSPSDQTMPIPALKRLGPMPFARPGFPLMGFLATVYEHVATRARSGSDG